MAATRARAATRPRPSRAARPAPVVGAPAPPGAVRLLDRAAGELAQAAASSDPGERFVLAHLAALRAGAAVVAARQVPGGRRRGPVNVWESLLALAPELAEWVQYFGLAAERRAGVESGRGAAVEAPEADAHLAQAEAFTALVAGALDVSVWPGGLPLAAS